MGKCSTKTLTRTTIIGLIFWLLGSFSYWFAERIDFFIRDWSWLSNSGVQAVALLLFFVPPILKGVGLVILAWIICEVVYRISCIYDKNKP